MSSWGPRATARATTKPHSSPPTAAAGVKTRNASDSRIGWLMVKIAHALRLPALAHTPRTRLATVDVEFVASRYTATVNASPTVRIVDTSICWGSGHVVARA